MSKLFALLSPASRVKSRRTVLSMTHRLTFPYFLDDGAMSILGEHFLADGRMDDGGRFISSPLHSGGESDKSFAGKAPALSLAVRAPAGWKRPDSLCHAGPASGAGPRQPGRCVGAFAQFLTLCSASNLAETRRISSPLQSPSLAKTRTSLSASRAHVDHLHPSTNC